jgi:BirA family biotin operon repressor/biotin-[acetyl-CoA-carboxylase] ligase
VIQTLPETGSTNADLLAQAAAGAPEGLWLRAERQTGGRGRLGRAWVSPPGNLYASTIVRPLAGDPPATTLAFVAAIAIYEVAAAYAGPGRLQLKWPNDLLGGHAKLAGILLEAAGGAVVIGFGINLAHHPDTLDRPTTSLAALAGAAPDPHAFLVDLAESFARWLARWRSEGFEPVRLRWLSRAHPIGSALRTSEVAGLFEGLAPDGALLLRHADGRIETVRAGDVALA